MRLIGILFNILSVLAGMSLAADTTAVESSSTRALQKLSWLIGSWRSTVGADSSYEAWQTDTANRLKGMGFTVSGKDTSIFEELWIEASDSGLFYISDVAHNPSPVRFRMTRQDSLATVFENPAHDFPTRIIYRQITADSMYARIEGMRKGKEAGIDFVFERLK